MHPEQVLKSQFNIDLTCSQIMQAEQVLKSQFNPIWTGLFTQHGKFSQVLCIWDLVASHIFMWHINLFTFYKNFWQEVTKMELCWI